MIVFRMRAVPCCCKTYESALKKKEQGASTKQIGDIFARFFLLHPPQMTALYFFTAALSPGRGPLNLGGGSRILRLSRDLTRTTREWMAQDTQYWSFM